MSEREERQDLTPEELEGQEAEQLPDREAMSILYPPSPVGPVPLSDVGTADVDPVPPDQV